MKNKFALYQNSKLKEVTPVTVIAFLGESNQVGRHGPIDAGGGGLDEPNPNILMLESTGDTLVLAEDPLDHFDETPDSVGMGLSAAKDLLAVIGGIIVIVPCAKGSSGWNNGDWNWNDFYYTNAISRINTAMAQAKLINPSATFGGFCNVYGSHDSLIFGLNGKEFGAVYRQFLLDLRRDVTDANAKTPIVNVGLPPDWIPTPTYGTEVDDAINDITLIDNAYFIDTIGADSEGGDIVHFSAASGRLLGSKFEEAYQLAISNDITPPTLPAQPTGNLQIHFDMGAAPDGYPIIENSDGKRFQNKRVYFESGKMVFFGNAAASRLVIDKTSISQLATNDFSIKAAINIPATSGDHTIISYYGNASNKNFKITVEAGFIKFTASSNGSSDVVMINEAYAFNGLDKTIEFVRAGDELQYLLDDVNTAQFDTTGFTFFSTSVPEWQLGANNGELQPLDGLIESLTYKILNTVTTTITSPDSVVDDSLFNVPITFGAVVTGFDNTDISVTNASKSGFSGSGDTYGVDITPDGSELDIEISIPYNAGQDGLSNPTQSAISIVTYGTVALPASLVLWYNGDLQGDASGISTIDDQTTNGNDSTVTGTLDIVSSAYDFPSATTEYGDFAIPKTSEGTIYCRIDQSFNTGVFFWLNLFGSDDDNSTNFAVVHGKVQFALKIAGNINGIETTSTFTEDTNLEILINNKGGVWDIFVNGVSSNSVIGSNTGLWTDQLLTQTGETCVFGARKNGGVYSSGYEKPIQDLKIFDVAMDWTEYQALSLPN